MIEITPPENVGLSPARLALVSDHLKKYVDEGKIPGFQVLVARRGQAVYLDRYGLRDVEDDAYQCQMRGYSSNFRGISLRARGIGPSIISASPIPRSARSSLTTKTVTPLAIKLATSSAKRGLIFCCRSPNASGGTLCPFTT